MTKTIRNAFKLYLQKEIEMEWANWVEGNGNRMQKCQVAFQMETMELKYLLL